MKKTIKITTVTVLTAIILLFSCKKKDEVKSEEPTPPATQQYTAFTTTIAVIDYTAPIRQATIQFSNNIGANVVPIAYIVADGSRIDSLPLKVCRVPDMNVPSNVTWSPTECDAEIWVNYTYNVKEFKLKANATNSLSVYENDILISSVPIVVDPNYTHYDYNKGYKFGLSPFTVSGTCADGRRFKIVH